MEFKKKRMIIKRVTSYVLALMVSVIFALYLNANVGWYMLIALIIAPLISVFFAFITAKSVKVSCDIRECVLSKGDKYSITATISNRFIFPTTPIELYVLNGDGVKSNDKRIICSVLPLSDSKVKISFEARICGPSYVGIEQVRVTDYLGLWSFKLKKIDSSALQKKVAVIPDIADISIRDDRILKVMHASMNADDSEDTIETSTRTFGGFPGYDNRDYVPGDPIKRINWKQSAKRDRLLVRLDDEMASRATVLVLDSTFIKSYVETNVTAENIPKLAEDAVENALGIARSLVLSNYTVRMYVRSNEGFVCYEITDDKDIESVCLIMADYTFLNENTDERFSKEVLEECESGMVISTPGAYIDLYGYLEGKTDISKLSVFSAYEENRGNSAEDTGIVRTYSEKKIDKTNNKKNTKEKLKELTSMCLVPFILAMLLSVTIFSIYDVQPWSLWFIPQLMVCMGAFALCIYTTKHRMIGGLSITVLVVGILMILGYIMGGDKAYVQWFMSGGSLVQNEFGYLVSLILVFSVFFSMVVFYYTKIYYRTSALLFVSTLPFLIYVKVIKDIPIVYVMLVVSFNVFVFLVNIRKNRDKGKRIEGNFAGILSVCLFAAVFVMTALAIPKSQETKYYYIFEELFLGGNTSVELPDTYKTGNEYSGNADGFNQITNRKLYVVSDVNVKGLLYLRRQVFDFYNKELERWYKDSEYSDHSYVSQKWKEDKDYLNSELLADAFLEAEKLSQGFLDKYGLKGFVDYDFINFQKSMTIHAQNYESDTYITPLGSVKIEQYNDRNTMITPHGIFGSIKELLPAKVVYEVYYYDQGGLRDAWTYLGGANFNNEEALEMLNELATILKNNEQLLYFDVVKAFKAELEYAIAYNKRCNKDNMQISDKVKELALSITGGYKYDWEKAKALQDYFYYSGFVYDLEYNAPDDSVEYFLFESKTGTCSDFATAYVMMARSVGLTVRYVEGFVPTEEEGVKYDEQYVVRTSSSHAYPEVYIQNLGFVVYEPTIPSNDTTNVINGGAIVYAVTLGFRLLIIFAFVSFTIIVALFTGKIFIPVIKEKKFINKAMKTVPTVGIIMLYVQLIDKYSAKLIDNASVNTPCEYADVFKKMTQLDIGILCDMVEMVVYENVALSDEDRERAVQIYKEAKIALKNALKVKKKLGK